MASHGSTVVANGVPELHPDIPHSVYADLDVNHTGLDVPADRLRRHLKIPDITTRSGLRKLHADFHKFNQRLDACYATALSVRDTTAAKLVCVIWTEMTADVLVREQLLRAGDI
ncbi:hypothetical protein GSI_09302 [Ganoderma sinense ZZ0214-1]|uniref:Uncharacterized protein n=1 Tax=Ganoderma sinense ZZ0214-1 TaxID=1077348 RepID=A0A2G8S658_9APHY|nr:hypothetical protein GSI_09302 [Ganoderma sinense ZZ0214-1]